MRISVLGATGSMGRLVIKSALQENFTVVQKVSSHDKILDLFTDTDVIIDFSCPIATYSMLSCCLDNKFNIPIIIGTTSLSSQCLGIMQQCSLFTPIFYSPNMSLGVSFINMMIYALSNVLNEEYDAEILDIHHKFKKDSPSGTALMLGKSIAKARGHDFDTVAVFSRYGIIPQRKTGEIGFCSQRCGNVTGTHRVSFIGQLDDIEIQHVAKSKEIFAQGAINAAKWIRNKQPKIYTMNDLTKDMVKPLFKSLYNEFFAN